MRFIQNKEKQMYSILITEDGSHTVYNQVVGQNFHSTHGAIQESKIVFIENGLLEVLKIAKEINVLEVGMGTGLNVLLSVLESKRLRAKINYVGVEPYPLPSEIISELNYAEILGGTEAKGYFNKIHNAGWVYPVFLSDYFILSKIQATLQEIELKENQFHLIYFDAFDAQAQAELWDVSIFQSLFECLKPGGVLVTYSCKGDVKRALKASGFQIEKLPGPMGKREVLRANKPFKSCNCVAK